MNIRADSLFQIEKTLSDIKQVFADCAVSGYKGAALYLRSSEDTHSVAAVMHQGKNEGDQQRADKYVYLRRLSDETTVAGQSFDQGGVVVAESMMFGKAHSCIHFPVNPNMRGADAAMLQLVFTGAQTRKADQVIAFVQDKNIIKALREPVQSLVQSVGQDRDQELHIRNPYTPDSVVVHLDISGYTGIANKIGHDRAHMFADTFTSGYIKDIAKPHGAELLRHEGDGLWLGFPIQMDDNVGARRFAGAKAQSMVRDVLTGFEGFARSQDRAFEGARLKAIMELGELKSYDWEDQAQDGNAMQSRSGPVFTFMRKAAKTTKNDGDHVVLAGSELMATIKGGDTFYVDSQKYHSLNFEG